MICKPFIFLLFTIKEQEIMLIMCERFIFMEIKKKGDHTCKFFSLSFFFLLFRRFITLPSRDMGVDECEAGKLDLSTLESFQAKV